MSGFKYREWSNSISERPLARPLRSLMACRSLSLAHWPTAVQRVNSTEDQSHITRSNCPFSPHRQGERCRLRKGENLNITHRVVSPTGDYPVLSGSWRFPETSMYRPSRHARS